MKQLIEKIIKFRDQRHWEKFHNIKDLLIGLNMEVAELQELFLWKDEDSNDEINLEEVKNELADIFIFLAYISSKYDIDLEEAINDKMKIHNKHYPIKLSKNNTKKYTEFKDGENR